MESTGGPGNELPTALRSLGLHPHDACTCAAASARIIGTAASQIVALAMWRESLSTRPRVPLAVSLVALVVAASLPGALGFLSPFASLPRTRLSSATLYTLRSAAPAAMRRQCVAVLAAEGTNAPGEPAGAAPVPTRPLVICGPSGVGKGTLIELLRQEFAEDIGFCVRPRACARARTRPRTPPERATPARTPSNRPADARAPTPGLAHDARPAPRGGPRAALLVH